jgi:hypothetical protein
MPRPNLSRNEIEALRKANVPVPGTTAELLKLLESAEKDRREIPLDDAFKSTRLGRRLQ